MGQIPVSSNSTRQVFITNLDTKDLVINSFTLSNNDGIKILNNPGTTIIKFLESFTLEIEFFPNAGGSYESQLSFSDNAKSGPSSLMITGEATAAAVPTFERIFGIQHGTGISSVIQTADGGYMLGGSATLSNANYSDFYIAKTDEYGSVLWTKIFGNDYDDGVSKMLQTTDGGYMLLGNTNTNQNGATDIYFAKLDSSGNIEWEKTYGGAYNDVASSLVETSNGYLILGSTLSFGDGSSNVYVISVDDSGKINWQNNYGGSGGDTGSQIIKTKDNNYTIIGATSSIGNGNFDFYLIKIDSSGNKLWEKSYGGSDWDEGHALAEMSDGSLILAGFAVGFGPGARDIFLIKTDSNGNEIWHKAFGGLYQDDATSVVSESDGILLSGSTTISIRTQSEDENVDAIVLKTDNDGNEIWQSTFGGRHDDGFNCMLVSSLGSIILAGATDSYSQNSNAYFISISSSGEITNVQENTSLHVPSNFELLNNYPNPFNGETIITYKLPEKSNVDFSVFNTLGQNVLNINKGTQSAGIHRMRFNSGALSSGVYLYQIKTKFGTKIQKMLLLK
jgi:hypothetical protein